MTGYAAEERHLREMLAMLQNSYEKAAKPYVDRLVALHSRSQPQMFVTIEQAQALGLMPDKRTEPLEAQLGRISPTALQNATKAAQMFGCSPGGLASFFAGAAADAYERAAKEFETDAGGNAPDVAVRYDLPNSLGDLKDGD